MFNLCWTLSPLMSHSVLELHPWRGGDPWFTQEKSSATTAAAFSTAPNKPGIVALLGRNPRAYTTNSNWLAVRGKHSKKSLVLTRVPDDLELVSECHCAIMLSAAGTLEIVDVSTHGTWITARPVADETVAKVRVREFKALEKNKWTPIACFTVVYLGNPFKEPHFALPWYTIVGRRISVSRKVLAAPSKKQEERPARVAQKRKEPETGRRLTGGKVPRSSMVNVNPQPRVEERKLTKKEKEKKRRAEAKAKKGKKMQSKSAKKQSKTAAAEDSEDEEDEEEAQEEENEEEEEEKEASEWSEYQEEQEEKEEEEEEENEEEEEEAAAEEEEEEGSANAPAATVSAAPAPAPAATVSAAPAPAPAATVRPAATVSPASPAATSVPPPAPAPAATGTSAVQTSTQAAVAPRNSAA